MLEEDDLVALREFRQRIQLLLQSLGVGNEALYHVRPRLFLTRSARLYEVQCLIPD